MEDLLRELAPRVLAVLVRKYGSFAACEDAVQEALIAAYVQWPIEGTPAGPMAWLIRVAHRRLVDAWRSETARHDRELTAASRTPADELVARAADEASRSADDTLTLLFLCCHPALSLLSQAALTLRAIGGLTTGQIAHAFLVPEATMGQRISRAKQRIKSSDIDFRQPSVMNPEGRLQVVLHVLYVIFNEGYMATSGPDLRRPELSREAIRLTRELHRLLPNDGEVAGLLALMLLTEARHPARTGPGGILVPLADQDRTLWNREYISEGTDLLTRALTEKPVGIYQLQAAIAAVHDEAGSTEHTDWSQILVLYRMLEQLWPNPVVRLGQAVATAMVDGPREGLAIVAALEDDTRIAGSHRLHAVRAHLLEMSGDHPGARDAYLLAARRARSLPERHYLEGRATRLP